MNSEFSRNIIKLSSGSVAVASFSILITPINTRLFSPEDYGLVNLITTVSMVFGVLLSFNLNPVILMEKEEKEAETTATLSLLLLIVSLCVIGGILFFFGDWFLALLKAEKLKPWLILVFGLLVITGVVNIISQFVQRKKMYGLMAKGNIISNICGHIIRLPWGYFAPSFYALYLSNVIASLIPLPMWFRAGRWKIVFDRPELVRVFKKNFAFMSYQTMAAVIGTIGTYLPNVWIIKYCGAVELGFYAIAQQVIDLPCNMLLSSFQTVYYKRVADTVAHEPEKLMNLYWRNTWKLTLLGLIPLSLVALISPFIPYILGERWASAVPIIQLFLIWRFIRFVMLPTSAVIVILRKNYFHILSGILGILGIVIASLLAEKTMISFFCYILSINFIVNILILIYTFFIIKHFQK